MQLYSFLNIYFKVKPDRSCYNEAWPLPFIYKMYTWFCFTWKFHKQSMVNSQSRGLWLFPWQVCWLSSARPSYCSHCVWVSIKRVTLSCKAGGRCTAIVAYYLTAAIPKEENYLEQRTYSGQGLSKALGRWWSRLHQSTSKKLFWVMCLFGGSVPSLHHSKRDNTNNSVSQVRISGNFR